MNQQAVEPSPPLSSGNGKTRSPRAVLSVAVSHIVEGARACTGALVSSP